MRRHLEEVAEAVPLEAEAAIPLEVEECTSAEVAQSISEGMGLQGGRLVESMGLLQELALPMKVVFTSFPVEGAWVEVLWAGPEAFGPVP
jgi:hypothetical protein